MAWIDVLRVSIGNLLGNRLRSLLTILGVAIGIGAIVFLYSLGTGLQKLTVERIAKSATLSSIDVSVGKSQVLELNAESIRLLRGIPNVKDVSASTNLPGQVVIDGSATDVVIIGAEASYAELYGLNLAAGTFLDRKFLPTENVQPVVLSTAALKLFEINTPSTILGKKITANLYLGDASASSELKTVAREYMVGGVIEDDQQVIAFIPLDDVRALGVDDYTGVKIQVSEAEHIETVKNAITQQGYLATSVADLIIQIRRVFSVIQTILAGFGVIALLVASIGMFNTLTIALLERTRDIGIMKAIGARSKDIRRLFLTEALMIGGVGGVGGIILAIFMGTVLNLGFNFVARRAGGEAVALFSYEPLFLGGVILFALFVGLLTGFYPARRASKLNPLKALRYE